MLNSRDANGTSHGSSSGSFRTTYRDASGRTSGSAGSAGKRVFSGKGSLMQFREASCRVTGPVSYHGTGSLTTTRRDTSSRYTGKITGSGACVTGTHMPVPPTGTNK